MPALLDVSRLSNSWFEPRSIRIAPHVGWVNIPNNGRGTTDILQSCLLTTFFATWTSLHLNIPHPGTPTRKILRTHLVWTTACMVAPEVVTCVAMTQFLEALIVLRKLDRLYTAYYYHRRHWHGWRLCHAFYYNMRGFVVRSKQDQHRARVLKMKHLDAIVERDWLRLITKPAESIKDRSKADRLAKTVALVQALWLVAQVGARFAHRLPVSPLEISTVAYVACALFSYLLWLEKPQDVTSAETVDARFAGLFQSPPASHVPEGGWKAQLPNLNRRLDGWQRVAMGWTFLGVASLFGGLHGLAWNYEFPTLAEQRLWRTSCVGLVSLPPLFYVSRRVWESVDNHNHHHHHHHHHHNHHNDRRGHCWPDLLTFLLVFVYVVFRLYNLFEVFFCLRSAPAGLYQTVGWTQWIPHL